MRCPDTGHACFEVNCQLKGCQGDGLRMKRVSSPAPQTLEARLLDMLREGGMRKVGILQAWAVKAGFELGLYISTVNKLKARGQVRVVMQYGGQHLKATT